MPNTLYFRSLAALLKTADAEEITAALRLAPPTEGIHAAEFRNHVLRTLVERSDALRHQCLTAAFELCNLSPADLLGGPPLASPDVPTLEGQESRFEKFSIAPLPAEAARVHARSVPHAPVTPAQLLNEALTAHDSKLAKAAVLIDPLAVSRPAYLVLRHRMPDVASLALAANPTLATNVGSSTSFLSEAQRLISLPAF